MGKKGIIPILLIFAIALSLTTVAYAMWSQTLRANVAVDTGEVDWEIYNVNTWLDACGLPPGSQPYGNDWFYNASLGNYQQIDKDVGCTWVTLIDSDGDGDDDTMNVTIKNAYPWYYTHIAFKVHNNGQIPIKIWRIIIDGQTFYEINEHVLYRGLPIDLDGDGKDDIMIWWGDNFGVQLEPCQPADISFDLTVLQEAPENSVLSFTISFDAIQWNEYEEHVPQGD
ncbi:MAG: hypothetical protein J7L51_01165 [Desulfurococcales archaeon]|nr:hypothetical protein [Desulfurococcales archaeon]